MAAATVLFAHGDAAHAERYQYAAARLNGAGHEVIALEHEGSSAHETPTRRQFDRALAEMEQLVGDRSARAESLVVFGNGVGAAVALACGVAHQAALGAMILSAPLSQIPAGPLRQMLHRLGTTLLPDAPAARTPGVRDPDPVVDIDYLVDPLTRLGQIPMSSGAATARREAALTDGIEALTLPTLLLWGTRDGVSPAGGAEHLLGPLEHTQLTRGSFDVAYAEVLFSSAREAALDTVTAWLDALATAPR